MNIWISSQDVEFMKALKVFLKYELSSKPSKISTNIFSPEKDRFMLSNPHLDIWILECDYDFWEKNQQEIYIMVSGIPNKKILLITSNLTPNFINEIIEMGFKGIYNKHFGFVWIKDALEAVYRGEAYLTPDITSILLNNISKKKPRHLSTREYQILIQLAHGNSYKLIADSLGITIHTVRQHVRNLYQKLKVNSKAEAIRKYYQGTLEI